MDKEKFYTLLENPDLLNTDSAQELKKVVVEYPFFQAAWFLYLKNLKEINSPEYDAVLKRVAVQVPDRKLLYHFLNTEKVKPKIIYPINSRMSNYNLEDNFESEPGDSLIDKFLLQKPGRIERKSKGNVGSLGAVENDVIKNSVSENDEILTETLAMLYFQQKNYTKALEAFEKLSLKYPEKSVYFATRIEEIEKLKNI